ncbi:MAG: putative isomerase [Cyclobacteriaceae bacterium]|nr:MAG: putative isomerase [Cyclobacteriaceae bacterium]
MVITTIPIYQIDAFTDRLFGGNPAAVCLLDSWPEDEVLQNIARENNLAEIAFLVKNDHDFHIRWFTPAVEVALCGHATLAAAHVLFELKNYAKPRIVFSSLSGPLVVTKEGTNITLDFPVDPVSGRDPVPGLFEALGIQGEVYQGKTDLMIVVEDESAVRSVAPDFRKLAEIEVRGVIVTAPGTAVDFVSRFFAPASGIDEDPVTGSAHCTLTPYWSKRLKKTQLSALQLSARKGHLHCELSGDRVKISGAAITYLTGTINF